MSDKDQAVDIAVLNTHFEHIKGELTRLNLNIEEKNSEREALKEDVAKLKYWRTAIISVSAFLWSFTLVSLPYIYGKISIDLERTIDARITVVLKDYLEDLELVEVTD